MKFATELSHEFSARLPLTSAGAEATAVHLAKKDPIGRAVMAIPGSKSWSNRAVVLAGMNRLPLELDGFLFADDTFWGLHALQSMGFAVEVFPAAHKVIIEPPSPQHPLPPQVALHFGKAGTLARFFPAVILNFGKTYGQNHFAAICDGHPQLMGRPLDALILALRQLGGFCLGNALPAVFAPSDLSGQCSISGATSGQFLSGLLLAAGGAKKPIRIQRTEGLVQPDYVRMTIAALRDFGADIRASDDLVRFEVHAPEGLSRENYRVEADASTAAAWLGLAALGGVELEIINLGSDSLQPDVEFLDILARMGFEVQKGERLGVKGQHESTGSLKGGQDFSMERCSDQALLVGVLALFADAPVQVSGVGHIRHHESNRIGCLVKNLRSLGAEAEETSDGFRVSPLPKGFSPRSLKWETWNDHRFAMAGAVLATRLQGLVILNPKCVEKTAPGFFVETGDLGFHWASPD